MEGCGQQAEVYHASVAGPPRGQGPLGCGMIIPGLVAT